MNAQKQLKVWGTVPKIKNIRAAGVEVDTDILEDVDIDNGNAAQLIVHNDNVNTFGWVIQTFIELLQHTAQQAEQCALLIHTKGKCQVKSGSYDEMCTLKGGIIDRGLSATVE